MTHRYMTTSKIHRRDHVGNTLPGSGNHIVDAEDDAQHKVTRLPCDCQGRCKCDDNDEREEDTDARN